MSTLTLAVIRSLVRSDLNESGTTILSDTELNAIINDGMKDVAVKGLCYENKIAFDNIATTQKIVPLLQATNHILRVNFVEYKTGTTEGGLGMLGVLPQTIGHSTINGNTPQYWFQWGDFLIVEPITDAATYDLAVYATCYPAAVLSADGEIPSSLPVEFHEEDMVGGLQEWNDLLRCRNVVESYLVFITEPLDGNILHPVIYNCVQFRIAEDRGSG